MSAKLGATLGKLNACTAFDFKAVWKVNNTLTLKAGVINRLGKSYGNQRGVFPGLCRTAYVALALSF